MPVPLRVLIVEDQPDDAKLLMHELRRAGFEPTGDRVDSPEDLLARLDPTLDVILSDYRMPGFNGLDALRLAQEHVSEVPFILISGTIGEDQAVEAMQAGATDYLLKDRLARLGTAVRQAMERRQLHQEHARTERVAYRLAAIVQSTQDGVIGITLDGVVTDWNLAAARIYGWSSTEAIGKHVSCIVPADRSDELHDILERLRHGERIDHFETVRLRKDGTLVDISVSVSPTSDAMGKIIGAASICRDISEQKRAEQAQSLLAAVVDSSEDAIVCSDLDGHLQTWNEAAARLFGYSASEVIGCEGFMLPHHLVPSHFVAEIQDARDRIVRGGSVTPFETVRLRKDGQPVHVSISMSAVKIGGRVMAISAIFRDITERKRAERNRRMLESIIEYSPNFIGIAELDHRVIFVNRSGQALLGLESAEAARKTSIADYFPPEEWERFKSEVLPKVREQGQHIGEGKVRHFKTGEIIPADWIIFTIPDSETREPAFLACIANDSRERVRAAEALRASEQNFRTLAEAMPQIVWITGPDGWNTYFNQQWMDYTGLTLEESLGHGWNKPFHPEDQQRAWDAWQTAVETVGTYSLECRLRRADGAYRWWLIRGVPLRDASGKVLKWFGTCTDIHDLKQAEEALHASEERYRVLTECLPGGIFKCSADGMCDYCNQWWCNFTGLNVDQASGTGWFDALHPDDRQWVKDLWFDSVRSGRPFGNEMRFRGADGNYRWFIVRAVPLKDEDQRIARWLGTCTDIEERKQLQMQFHDAQRRLQHVVATSPAVLFTLAIAGDQIQGISWISDNLLQILGHLPAAALGSEWWIANVHPNDRDRIIRETHDGFFSDGYQHQEYRFRHGDGTYRWTRQDLRLIRDHAGHPVEAVGSWSDITDRKNLEDQFRQAQKMDAFGQLAGGIAHDFNNLLTIINGFSEIALQGLSANDKTHGHVAEILKAGERSASLTGQLLAFSRKQVIVPKVLNLNEVVNNIEKMLERIIGEDIELATSLTPHLGATKADVGAMEQVLINLAVNARDAMPTGGKLTIETKNVELNQDYVKIHSSVRPGRYVLLTVSDNGCGMSPEVKARIFEPFFTTKGVGKGTGLGLATVHGIVNQAEGHIEVYSEPGIGTCFKIYLPRVTQRAEGSKHDGGTQRILPGRESILLVEDEAGLRSLLSQILTNCGYSVLVAANGNEALRIAKQQGGPIDCVVTDVVMPGLGGRQMVEQLVALYPKVKVLYLSGYTDDAVVRYGILHEQVPFLQKPFSPATLSQKLREVLDS